MSLHTRLKAKIGDPIVEQLTQGLSPEKIALTVAVGLTIAVNPIIGTTTILCFAAAWALRLNQPIIQAINWSSYALQLLLIFPFIRLGERIFRAEPERRSVQTLATMAKADTLGTIRTLGATIGHAAAAWILVAPLLTAAIYFGTRPIFRALARRVAATGARASTMWPEALRLAAYGSGVVAVVMVAAWLVHLRTKNAGIVDVAWSANLALLAALYAALGSGLPARRLLVALMGGIAGLRLAAHIHRRAHGKPEDGRYTTLRSEWGGNIALKFLFFFLFQGVDRRPPGGAFPDRLRQPRARDRAARVGGLPDLGRRNRGRDGGGSHARTLQGRTRKMADGPAGRASGGTHGIPTTSSNGSSGSPTRSSRSRRPADGWPSPAPR